MILRRERIASGALEAQEHVRGRETAREWGYVGNLELMPMRWKNW